MISFESRPSTGKGQRRVPIRIAKAVYANLACAPRAEGLLLLCAVRRPSCHEHPEAGEDEA